ncbi:stAR-related lipid transfer protein 3-like isoform X2 [Actinia tenebrosa]|uniref:StAR-related lipid transfer protein 3-like isoform X2 n=1 Tax=Actinia tenebrosa TaxID=6105 RepID=A0A6P8IUP6_ACTTE|nr:stAR-related lipid transfer protein 3-like isoform X2 [Actinia tenebrosa]
MDRLPNGISRRSYSSGSRTDSTTTFRQFSPSRRMFCLLTVFDFFFILVAWLIYANAFNGLNLSLEKEVAHYKIASSLFDIVLLSLWRMVVLLLVYALFHSRKWYAIAITTSISTGFIIAKVVEYNFKTNNHHPMDYVSIIVSLFLCWAETLFLDFKVFPSELKAEQRMLAGSLDTTAGERRPLLDENPSSYHTRTWLTEQSSFYTPYGSPPSSITSEDEGEDANAQLSSEDVHFKRKAKEIFGIAWDLLTVDKKWKHEKNKDGIIVESCILKDTGKMFKVQCSIDAPPSVVFSLIVLRVEDGPKWNSSVAESRVLHKIDNHTDICYNVTTDQAGGMVSSRDFVNLRHWQKRGKAYFSCNASVEYQDMPPVNEHIRGENHPGGWLFAENEGHHDQTDFVMLVNTDLKGWLPQYLIDQAMTGVLFGTADCLRNYVHSQK